MKEDKSSTTVSGIGFCSLLAIAFIVLKLCKVITWSWWWVLSPIWIPSALFALIVILWLSALELKSFLKRIRK